MRLAFMVAQMNIKALALNFLVANTPGGSGQKTKDEYVEKQLTATIKYCGGTVVLGVCFSSKVSGNLVRVLVISAGSFSRRIQNKRPNQHETHQPSSMSISVQRPS
ncbi:hypothetical protein CRENBAI_021578 [Crenichthys baileyi]|uniref:Uncharacterized protein n=1 Tax=Crenichthys baileyi TaxID=28760 RepID=A0AAV9SNE2_9TELE